VALNLVVALLTGSTVMLSMALQGLSDLTTAGILYTGVKRSKRKADLRHQFGYGREIFFWVLIAGVSMFVGTGGLSVYLGYQQLFSPEPVESIGLALAMLLFGFITNGFALSLSIRRLRGLGETTSWWRQLWRSSVVETKATLLVDFLGTSAALLGFMALLMYSLSGDARFDGLGSIAIGLSMMVASALLIRDVRDLIVGRAVDPEKAQRIETAALSVEGIQAVLDLRTTYLGSDRLLVIIEVHVADGLDTDRIEQIVDNVKNVVQKTIPQVHHIQVEVETPDPM